MIYGIAENPQPTGKCVKYIPAAWGLKMSTSRFQFIQTLNLIFRSHLGKVYQFKILCFGIFTAPQVSHRYQVLHTEWSLLPRVFEAICEVHSCPHVVLTWTCLIYDQHKASAICVSSSRYHGLEARCISTSLE